MAEQCTVQDCKLEAETGCSGEHCEHLVCNYHTHMYKQHPCCPWCYDFLTTAKPEFDSIDNSQLRIAFNEALPLTMTACRSLSPDPTKLAVSTLFE